MQSAKFKIRKGDTVKILSGKDRGKTGKALSVFYKTGRVTVEGRNLIFRHERPRKQGQKGQKIVVPRAIPVSAVMLQCPHCGKTTRVGFERGDKGVKTRMCKKCNKRI